jgi:hypothetical protein
MPSAKNGAIRGLVERLFLKQADNQPVESRAGVGHVTDEQVVDYFVHPAEFLGLEATQSA